MKSYDFHVHSTYSDGDDDIESIIKAAVSMGLDKIGISDHSYTYFDTSYCLQKENVEKYLAEINSLKEKYKGKIEVFCGIESDVFSDMDLKPYDYVIGSSHYFKGANGFYPIDEGKENFIKIVKELFCGDYYSAAEEYFKNVFLFAENEMVNIIGHFDFISKYNGNGEFFDEKNERYINAYTDAAKKLISAGKVFEINTGDLRRKLRNDAYPLEDIRKVIKSLGGKFILSSDSHRKEDLTFGFDLFSEEL